MLKVDFINVGDGDAVLLRCDDGGITRTILIDCGRPHVEFVQGSKRGSCLDWLMREGVDRIDLMVISHLHFDHFGGALAVLRHMPVAKILALYLPREGARWIALPEREVKTIVGMCDVLNLWNDTIVLAESQGTECREADAEDLLIGDVKLRFILPDNALRTRQKALFHTLYAGQEPHEDELRAVSAERNCSSLIVLAEYADRRILLPGDSYASYWQDAGLPHCDILKLPHHGDGKSINETLLRSLSPAFAVISCQNDPAQKKDRPNAEVLALLLEQVPRVLCTENRPFPFYPGTTQDAIRFTIERDGMISCQGSPHSTSR